MKGHLYFPKLFFRNAKSVEKQRSYGARSSEYYWLAKNHEKYDFEYYEILKVTSYCHFDFSTFPLDTQHCSFLQMGTSDMILPRLFPSLNIENWYYRAGGFDIRIKPIGAFEGNHTTEVIGFNVTLERIIHPYLYQYYFPCIAIVVVSHISLIIPISAIPGRITLAVTQFLTLTNIFIHFMVGNIRCIKIVLRLLNP